MNSFRIHINPLVPPRSVVIDLRVGVVHRRVHLDNHEQWVCGSYRDPISQCSLWRLPGSSLFVLDHEDEIVTVEG
jgi:hypothetical protein